MIRTRDFFLFLVVVAFLLVVISVETARQWFAGSGDRYGDTSLPAFVELTPASTTAEVVVNDPVDRAGNIARLRAHLASFVPPTPVLPEIVTPPTATTTPDTPTTPAVSPAGTARVCAGYAPYGGAWPNQLLTISEQEGVRVISASTAVGPEFTDQVVAVLPIRTVGNALTPTCLTTDVVAIAQSGSLIRVTDVAGYRAFPEHILIGYTLDGFPLYGNSTRPTDQCGGVVVDGSYRYYLSSARETVIDCFVAPPIALP